LRNAAHAEKLRLAEPALVRHGAQPEDLSKRCCGCDRGQGRSSPPRSSAELEWKPMHVMTDVSVSIGTVMKPAGLEVCEGVLSAQYLKDASDPQWKYDEGIKTFMAFIDNYMPGANISDLNPSLRLCRGADYGAAAEAVWTIARARPS
jgi:hypothetical protein